MRTGFKELEVGNLEDNSKGLSTGPLPRSRFRTVWPDLPEALGRRLYNLTEEVKEAIVREDEALYGTNIAGPLTSVTP